MYISNHNMSVYIIWLYVVDLVQVGVNYKHFISDLISCHYCSIYYV